MFKRLNSARMIGTALVLASFLSGCMMMKGPFGTGAAVHERLTRETVRRADSKNRLSASDIEDVVAGVRWNDDPLDEVHATWRTRHLIEAAPFAVELERTGHEQRVGRMIGELESLPARSHYGDFQFLHAMNGTGLKPPRSNTVTRAKIFEWCHFAWDVACGQQDVGAPLDRASSEIVRSISKRYPNATIGRLFHVGGHAGDGADEDKELSVRRARHTALGSILHIIQDSYAMGHVKREGTGRVVEFLNYGDQDPEEHERMDDWQCRSWYGGEPAIEDGIACTPGAKEAVDYGEELVRLFLGNEPWEKVVTRVIEPVFGKLE
jgi:hypothetical protein